MVRGQVERDQAGCQLVWDDYLGPVADLDMVQALVAQLSRRRRTNPSGGELLGITPFGEWGRRLGQNRRSLSRPERQSVHGRVTDVRVSVAK